MNTTTRQKNLWQTLLKFDPTDQHLAVWTAQIKTAIKYQQVLDGLTDRAP